MYLEPLVVGADEMFDPILDPFERQAELHRRPGHEDLLRIGEEGLHPEAAARVRRRHVELLFGHSQDVDEPGPERARGLGRGPDLKLPRPVVEHGRHASRLHGHRRAAVERVAASQDDCSLAKRALRIADDLDDATGYVARRVVVHARALRPHGIEEAHDRRQVVEVDDHVLQRVLRDVSRFRDHHGDDLADEIDLTVRERMLRPRVHEVRMGKDHGQGTTDRSQRRVVEDGEHPAATLRGRKVDAAQPRMRHGAAHEGDVGRPWKLDVVEKSTPALEQPCVLRPPDRLPKDPGHPPPLDPAARRRLPPTPAPPPP